MFIGREPCFRGCGEIGRAVLPSRGERGEVGVYREPARSVCIVLAKDLDRGETLSETGR